jgi:diguanylate cyclase (GGDEF)-like protein
LPSIKNSILENWQGPKTVAQPLKSVYHFAIKQTGISIDFHLDPFFKKNNISLHFFNDFEDLITISRRYTLNAILIAGIDTFIKEIDLVRSIKQNVFLSFIPTIMFHNDPDENIVIAAYERGVEDFIYGDWREKLIEVRIKRILERSRRDMSINPSTQLPGPNIIEDELTKQIEAQSTFSVCYADLDNFKAYNDYYGYFYGDKIIRLTAKIIKDVVFDLCREGFLGHIAGDDFIFIVPPEDVDLICSKILNIFDSFIPYRYKEVDRQRGSITVQNRRGVEEEFPLLTLSIAVLINENGKFTHVGEMSKMLADLKKGVKLKEGSNYMVERRKKY